MFSVDYYLASIKSRIEKQSDLLVEKLKAIFSTNFPSEIDLIDFSAFIEPTRFEISIRSFLMDKDANEVFYDENSLTDFAGDEQILPEIEYYQLNDNQLDAFFNFYEQNEETLVPKEQKIFTDWFRKCWEKAGGASFHLPTYFCFHDDYKSYDLKNMQWIDDEQKWS